MKSGEPSRGDVWPSGREKPIFSIKEPVDQIADRFGLKIYEERDDLDAFRAVCFFLDDIGPVVLMRYAHSPSPITDIYVDWSVSTAEAQRSISDVLKLTDDDIVWRQTTV